MKNLLINILNSLDIKPTTISISLAVLSIITITAVLIHILLHNVILKSIKKINSNKPNAITMTLLEFNLFQRLSLVLQGLIVHLQIRLWVDHDLFIYEIIQSFSLIWMAIFGLLVIFSTIDKIFKNFYEKTQASFFAIQGVIQSIKLFLILVCTIYIVSILIDKSPVAILSGLGAMSAVLMLVFKDTILGFSAGLQISSNNIVKVGDWIEMPKYGVNGDVVDIGLSIVRVRNFDKTITTVPTYALVSESFKNYRGMQESAARRIKRSILIDINSIAFLDEADIKKLSRAKLLAPYLEQKQVEIEAYNKEHGFDKEVLIEGRRLSNIGTFRAYLLRYLKSHKGIRQDMTVMVRQLDSNQFGLPLEIYCFANTTVWLDYEDIQSEIFDYAFSRLKEFGLKVYQTS